ncbi:MAG: protein kinase [Deltaproteobacteria bacterium]|nr:protein kinase [Deltaproteobacteria bacterium]
MASSSPSPLSGMVLDQRYRILHELKAGGMGTVYEAEQIRLGKRVAIKVLRPQVNEDAALRRFEREARLASRIRHRNVVSMIDFGIEDNTAYYVMELLEGRDLAALLLDRKALSWQDARPIVLQIARALRAAHRHGIVHRDVKPANCFIIEPEDDDEAELVKVLDFGIAKIDPNLGSDGGLTRTSELVGTVAYMSPEQAQSQPVDPRSDVYSLGVLIYQTLTGQLPFRDDNAFNVLLAHVREQPRPPRTLVPSIPEPIDSAVMKALSKESAHRFATMDAFRDALIDVPAAAMGSTTAIFAAPVLGSFESSDEPGAWPEDLPPTAILGEAAPGVVVEGNTTIARVPQGNEGVADVSGLHGPASGPSAVIVGAEGGPPSGVSATVPAPKLQRITTTGTHARPRIGSRTVVLWGVFGGAMALLVGATLGMWLATRGSTEPEDSASSRAAVVTDRPPDDPPGTAATKAKAEGADNADNGGAPEGLPVETAPSPEADAVVADEPGEVVPDEPGSAEQDTAEQDTAEDEPSPPPKPATKPKSSTSSKGRETDASVKSKLRRRVKKSCGAKASPGVTIRVSLVINETGAVTLPRVQPPHQTSELGRCARSEMSGARFPATGHRRVVSMAVDL